MLTEPRSRGAAKLVRLRRESVRCGPSWLSGAEPGAGRARILLTLDGACAIEVCGVCVVETVRTEIDARMAGPASSAERAGAG